MQQLYAVKFVVSSAIGDRPASTADYQVLLYARDENDAKVRTKRWLEKSPHDVHGLAGTEIKAVPFEKCIMYNGLIFDNPRPR